MNSFFLSEQVASELKLPRKLCSDTLGRLHERGHLNRQKLTRTDRDGVRRGICYRYCISRNGRNRLTYLKKRESFLYRAIALTENLEGKVKLNLARSQLYPNLENTNIRLDLLRTSPMLSSFAMIDAQIRQAFPAIKFLAENVSLAWAVSNHLERRGLIPPQENHPLLVIDARDHGMSDEEIVRDLLFKGVLWLKNENEKLKQEGELLMDENQRLKSELDTKKQVLALVPQILDNASEMRRR